MYTDSVCVSVHYSTTIVEGRRRRTSVTDELLRAPLERLVRTRPDATGRTPRRDATAVSAGAYFAAASTRTTRVRTRARARRRRRRRGSSYARGGAPRARTMGSVVLYGNAAAAARYSSARALARNDHPPRARLASRTELKMPVCVCGWVWVGGCGGRRARLARQYVLGPPAKWRAAAHRLTRVPSAASRAAARAARHGCPSSRRTGASASRVRSGSRRGACRHRRRRRRCWAGRCPSSRR